MVIILTRQHIEKLVTMENAIEVVEKAFLEIANSTADYPTRPYLDVAEYKGGVLLNIGYLRKMHSIGVKIASSYPANRQRNLPTVYSLITLHDPETGAPKAIMEGSYLTALKTGAVGGVAVKYLAKKDAETLLLIGAGTQAKAQLSAIRLVRKIKRVLVLSRHKESTLRFVTEISKTIPEIDIAIPDSLEKALKEADIVVTATTSTTPVINGEYLQEGVHINGIGSFTPDAAEIDHVSFLKAGRVFVDNYEAVEVGDIRLALEKNSLRKTEIYHLADVIVGKLQGRRGDKDITIFKSVGGAPYDVAVAQKTYELARERNAGIEIDI